jgi:GDP-L-fucose synthase
MDLSKERVLLTGATGFFGRHIARTLNARGVSVPYVKIRNHDLRIRSHADDLIDLHKPTVVIHCAAHCGGIGLNKEKPAELFYDNITMGVNLIDAAFRFGVKKFVQIGSVCEYPKFTPVPFTENNLWEGYPEETNAPYGIAKKALLVMGQAYRAQYNFNTIHLLPVNLYGPGDNFGPECSHVIPALIRKFIENKGQPSVSVWGSGNAFREFLYVEDAAEAVVLATEHYDGNDPVNIGTGNTISIRDLAAMIAAKVGYTGDITFDASMPDGQLQRCLSTSRARAGFGFEFRTSFSKGLDKTIDWYRS